jgi:hypothetical protein
MGFRDRIFGKGASPSAGATSSVHQKGDKKGIDLLVEICTRKDLMDTSAMWSQAESDLQQAGEEGSQDLATLLEEMRRCRSDGIGPAIAMSKRVVSTPELVASLEAIRSTDPVTFAVGNERFRPQIEGGGRIGWTDAEATRVKDLAKEALEVLAPRA